jgi:hypothetical protein
MSEEASSKIFFHKEGFDIFSCSRKAPKSSGVDLAGISYPIGFISYLSEIIYFLYSITGY